MNRNFTVICATFLMCAILIVFYGGNRIAKSSVCSADCGKEIYLTFDDGPSDRVTPKILDVLKDEGVKATFFIIGKNAASRRNVIKRELDEGHTVAVHSYSHDYNKIYASTESLIEDIDRCNKIIAEIAGKPSNLYRFPGGSFGLAQPFINAVSEHGLRYVDWNASTRDAELCNATPSELVSASVTTACNPNRVVLLAHDSTTKTATAEALGNIIRYYKNLDYSFKTF